MIYVYICIYIYGIYVIVYNELQFASCFIFVQSTPVKNKATLHDMNLSSCFTTVSVYILNKKKMLFQKEISACITIL